MRIHSDRLNESDAHRLLKSCVVPRPVAWISTVAATGGYNLAPYSCYTFVATKPPMVCFSAGRKGGKKKGTLLNIEQSKEFVVNVVPDSLAEQVTQTALEAAPHSSKWELAGVTSIQSDFVRPPRIAECPVAMECRLHQTLDLGESKHTLVIGEVIVFHVEDRFDLNGEVDVLALRPLARLSGDFFAKLGEIFEIKR
jgi:flavin reductase (DIM6/NTAB) family NADH-FMN oxidoreductase RutF